MSSILASGHSPKKEKKTANLLYICIAVAIVIAFVVIFMSGGAAIKQNKDADRATTPSTTDTPQELPTPENPATPAGQ